MFFDGEYRPIGKVDPAPIQAAVAALPDARWAEQSARQQVYRVHSQTETIPILFDPDMRHSRPTEWPALAEFGPLLRPAMTAIADHHTALVARWSAGQAGYFVRIILTRLAGEGSIASHRDNGFSLSRAHRIHLPIVTHPDTLFAVAGNIRHLPAGELWEINNRKAHAVRNQAPAPRIHAIFDYVVPGEPIDDPDGRLTA